MSSWTPLHLHTTSRYKMQTQTTFMVVIAMRHEYAHGHAMQHVYRVATGMHQRAFALPLPVHQGRHSGWILNLAEIYIGSPSASLTNIMWQQCLLTQHLRRYISIYTCTLANSADMMVVQQSTYSNKAISIDSEETKTLSTSIHTSSLYTMAIIFTSEQYCKEKKLAKAKTKHTHKYNTQRLVSTYTVNVLCTTDMTTAASCLC